VNEDVINIHLGELTLKGKNRGVFEKRLIDNIKAVVPRSRIKNIRGRILLYPEDADSALECLKKVFGISWFSRSVEAEKNVKKIGAAANRNVGNEAVKIETRRIDKKFPKTSIEISQEVAEYLYEKGKTPVVKNYKKMVLVEILKDKALVTFDRINGLGGLPYGSSGKLLALLSGGIDSPVASWLMMRRGCSMEFFHMHPFTNKKIKKSKMTELVGKLSEFSPKPLKLHAASYDEFYDKIEYITPSDRMIVFRRFIFRLGNRIAKKNKAKAMVTGDSLGQVASQTLSNLDAVGSVSSIPVFRPLIGMDKQEIIDIGRRIGTYDISIKPYQDCCALVAEKHPSIKPDIKKLEEIEKEIKIEKIVEKTLENTETI